jgi:S-formylglutathione hydrolase FrmB
MTRAGTLARVCASVCFYLGLRVFEGAGFYVDATEEKWREHYNMYTYVTSELQALVAAV